MAENHEESPLQESPLQESPLQALALMPQDIDLDALVQQHGLIYHDHVQREERQPGGGTRKVWMRLERPMTGAEVLSHRFDGEDVILTTMDGQKWRFTPAGDAHNLMED